MFESQEPDVSDLQAKLSASEERFRCLVEHSPNGVVVVDESGVIQLHNVCAAQLLRGQQENLRGQKFLYSLLAGKTSNIEIPISGGPAITLQMQVQQIDWNDGSGYLVILTDSTAHAKSVEVVNAIENELMQFSSILVHDVKAPLRNIKEIAAWIKEDYADALDATALADLELLKVNATQMNALAQGLLQFMQIGLKEANLTDVDLNDVMDHALVSVNADISHKAGKVMVSSLPFVTADADLMETVFIQLLRNSLLYCESEPVIEVFARERQPYWEIVFKDTGAGVDSQYLERIFNPLERLHSYSEHSGIGFGLAICKKIVDKHQGNIWMESENGVGNNVIVQIPTNPDVFSGE